MTGGGRPEFLWANQTLLDRLLISADGDDVGMVDDLELSDDEQPQLTALLTGSAALGPRLGGQLGLWWQSIGRRLRPADDPKPNRIPIDLINTLDPPGITLRANADDLPTRGLFDWTREKIVRKIPGHES
jgi:hypothetical protein